MEQIILEPEPKTFRGLELEPESESEICVPVSSEISDLCEISDLLLFVSYFASQKKEI